MLITDYFFVGRSKTHFTTIFPSTLSLSSAHHLTLRLVALGVLTLSLANAQVEPQAGTWRTWVVPSVSLVALPAPPTASAAGELQAVKSLMAAATDTTRSQVTYWDAGSPSYRWEQIAAQQISLRNLPAPLSTRAMALISVAMYDATVAAWDNK